MGKKSKGNANEPTGNETGEELQLGDEEQESSTASAQELLDPPAVPTLADGLTSAEVTALKDISDAAQPTPEAVADAATPETESVEDEQAGEVAQNDSRQVNWDDIADIPSQFNPPPSGDSALLIVPAGSTIEHSNEEQPVPEPVAETTASPAPADEVSNDAAAPADDAGGNADPEVPAAAPVAPEVEAPVSEASKAPFNIVDAVAIAPVEVAPEPESKSLTELRAKYKGAIENDGDVAWDYATLSLYDEKRVIPTRTTNKQWPVDVRRTSDVRTWPDGALIDWANGEIKTPNGVLADDLHDELYRRYRLPNNWTTQAAIEFINTGVKPAETAGGLLVDDRARSASALHHWSFQELRAAALGEIDLLGHSLANVVTTLRKRIGLTSTTSDDKIINSLKDNNSEVSMDNTLLEAKLEEIKNALSKPNLSAASAGAAHVVLYATIRKVLARDPENFHEGWLKLSTWFNTNYNALFTPEKARRGWSQINLPTPSLTTYEDLMTLLIRTRNPATRIEDAKIYNVEHMVRHVVNEKERQNVIGFYNRSY